MTNFLSGLYSGMSTALMIGYVVLIFRYIKNWKALPHWSIPETWTPKTSVSIIIPARNEADNIESCLESVSKQNFPAHLFEIILVDDHSEDQTADLAQQFIHSSITNQNLKISLVESEGSGKKAALHTGIKNATGDLIITTDADCIVPANWINYLVSYFEKHQPKFIAAPVNFHEEKNLFEKFQSLDYMGMMVITGAGIHGKFGWMSNGANLAYPREVFVELDGFSGIDNLASGDDMLFMQKVVNRYPNQIGFIKNKEATVHTSAKPTWASLLGQRIRWASKTGAYQQPQLVWTQSFVFIYCALIFAGILFSFFGDISVPAFLLGLIVVKSATDYVFLKRASRFFGKPELIIGFVAAEVMHIIYIFLTGLGSLIKKKHNWKGRRVS